ncbi:MAG: hypothetical protein JXP73_04760, partial [Deltaproteobacteria bacterium]|nr:hypothetical protein [Deltaproteobacteria bacterium]
MKHTRILAVLLVVGAAFAQSRPAAGAPLAPKDVPAPLRPWTAWALHGHEEAVCPTLAGRVGEDEEGEKECAWPARLRLSLDEKSGRFAQEWQVYKEIWVPLPGGSEHWPLDVRDGGGLAVVVESDGQPGVILKPGRHQLRGAFAWDSLPESLPVPPATGLLALAVRGLEVPFPERGEDGAVFLERTAAAGEEDALDLTVHRKVTDDIPLLLATRVTLNVSGKSREVLLGRSLPDGFVPLSIASPLPIRMEPDSRVRLQVRPGTWTAEIVARHEGPVTSLTRPAAQGPWQEGDEVWVFEARPNLRVAAVAAVPAIDPQQTTLPDEWKRLPAYAMGPGAVMRLEESRRGDSEPAPDRLSLWRTLWLDFDGGGYTVSDAITGSLHRSWRIEMNPPSALGRVAIAGRDQLITRLGRGGRPGVEIRQGKVALAADSRITGTIRDIPAVGWDQDFERVSASLALPPGWRLLHASGADSVSPTWLQSWTLYDLFLLVLITLATAKLFGWRVGLLALVGLALTFPEAGAPKSVWLAILAGEALLMLLHKPGKLRSLLKLYLAGAWLAFAIAAIPFLVKQIRQGLHPAHEQTWSAMSYETSLANLERQSASLGVYAIDSRGEWEAAKKELPMTPPPAPAELLDVEQMPEGDSFKGQDEVGTGAGGLGHDKSVHAFKKAVKRPRDKVADGSKPPLQVVQQARKSKLNVQDYDPNAMVQTGPGVPAWTWRTVKLSWNGPVQRAEHVRLLLIGPRTNLVLMLVRVSLFALLVFLFLRPPRLGGGWWWRAGAAAVALFVVLSPARARAADLPSSELLDDLRGKLTLPPECAPNCASISRMALDISPGRLRVRLEAGAASPTAVPLPGRREQWSPERVTVDGRAASAMVRTDDGVLFVALERGGHVIVLDGALPGRDTVQLSLPMKPRHVTVKAAGWTVAGVHEDGVADDDLQLTRVQRGDERSGEALLPSALPPFVRVERTLVLGLRWEMDTSIVRQSPLGSPVVLEVPLLPGESVTTQGIRVVKGKALVNMGAQESRVAWHSTLAEQAAMELRAPDGVPWVEAWRLDASPVWHAVTSGIPPVHQPAEMETRLPEWRPWPRETLRMQASRPAAVPGQTLTIQGSQLLLRPGLRTSDAVLDMQLRSSRGEQHTMILPAGAELKSVKVNGTLQPIRQAGDKVTLPISPGQQRLEIAWREAAGIHTLFRTPSVNLQTPSVNSEIRMQLSRERWILFLGGPRMGPSVLWWSTLVALFIIALALGRTALTPLKSRHWVLLGLGLSQVSLAGAAVVVAWLLAFGWRQKHGSAQSRPVFDLLQLVLVGLTVAALVFLFGAVETGLLRQPDMGISGNQSTATMLSWFQDRSGAVLARPWVFSVPLLVYRLAMLLWAIWLAASLLRWSRWL